MQELILYHYPLSPFSEKIRAMLGYTGLAWHSVIVREMPPRPELATLAGGYRRIPVAQLGADVFCDTRSVAREIARLGNAPELVVEHQSEQIQAFVAEADQAVFLASLITAGGPGVLWKMIRQTSLVDTWQFLRDRAGIARLAKVKADSPWQAKQRLDNHHALMNDRLQQQPFLFGDTPCIADFSAYHSLWFLCDFAGKPVLRKWPAVAEWFGRMRAFGHGQPEPMTSDDALALAKAATPRPVDGCDEARCGDTVTVAPSDYGRDPVTGRLCHADGNTLVVAHADPGIGTVHLHFPRHGFDLRPAAQ